MILELSICIFNWFSANELTKKIKKIFKKITKRATTTSKVDVSRTEYLDLQVNFLDNFEKGISLIFFSEENKLKIRKHYLMFEVLK